MNVNAPSVPVKKVTNRNKRFLLCLIWFVSICLLLSAAYRFADYCAWRFNKHFAFERLTCENPVHHFGTVMPGTKPSHTFLFKNTGSRTITIDKIISGCGGCVEIPDFQEQLLAPGQCFSVSVSLITKDQTGNVRKAVLVKYGARYKQNLVIYLEADVEKPIEIE